MIKDTIEKIKQTRFDLDRHISEFYDEFVPRFPSIMAFSSHVAWEKINEEMHIMLRSINNYKTVKSFVKNEFPNDNNYDYYDRLTIEQTCPIHRVGDRDQAFDWCNSNVTIDVNGIIKVNHKLHFSLDALKKEKKNINQEKLELFNSLVIELFSWKEKFDSFNSGGNRRYGDKEIQQRKITLPGLKFTFEEKFFEINLRPFNEIFNFNQKFYPSLSHKIHETVYKSTMDKQITDIIEAMLINYDDLINNFEKVEQEKLILKNLCDDFIDRISTINTPFKVLTQLKS